MSEYASLCPLVQYSTPNAFTFNGYNYIKCMKNNMNYIDLPVGQTFTAAISPNKAIPPDVTLILGVSPWAIVIETDHVLTVKRQHMSVMVIRGMGVMEK